MLISSTDPCTSPYLSACHAVCQPTLLLGCIMLTLLDGLGGMHSIISSLVMGQQNITKFTHSYGAPRTLNKAGADLYNFMFGGGEWNLTVVWHATLFPARKRGPTPRQCQKCRRLTEVCFCYPSPST